MQVGEIVQFYLTPVKTTYHVMCIPLQLYIYKGRLAMISSEADVQWVSFDCSGIMRLLVVF